MDYMVEFKLWRREHGTNWEYEPIYTHTAHDTVTSADRAALVLANTFQTEVRWNWQGSEQGHYVGTAYKFGLAIKE